MRVTRALNEAQKVRVGQLCGECRAGYSVVKHGKYGPYVECGKCGARVWKQATTTNTEETMKSQAQQAKGWQPDSVEAQARFKKVTNVLDAPWFNVLEAAAPVLGSPGPHRVLLWGPPGTAKSSQSHFLWDAERKRGGKTERIALTEDSTPEDVAGHYVLKGMDTLWVDGPAVRAWRFGAPLVLDEIDRASNSITSLLHALLDDPSIAKVTLPTGETVEPAPGHVVVATMNVPPSVLHEALLDRFDVVLYAGHPTPGVYSTLDKSVMAAVKGFYNKFEASEKWGASLSARRGLALTRLKGLAGSWEAACRLSCGEAAKEVLSTLASIQMSQLAEKS